MNSHSIPHGSADTQISGVPASPPSFPLAIWFFTWVLVVMVATLVTFMLPESYSSSTRINIERDHSDIPGMTGRRPEGYDPYYIQTQFELIQSEVVLAKVVEDVDLNAIWGKKYASGDRLKTSESLALLKGRIDLRPVRNTSLIEIRVYSEQSAEAAQIANVVANAYQEYRLKERASKISASIRVLEEAYERNNEKITKIQGEMAGPSREQSAPDTNRLDEARRRVDDLQHFGQGLFTMLAAEKTDLSLPATSMVQIVDRAVQSARPVRPNKPLNIVIGIIVGGLGGLFLATLVYVLQRREFRRKSGVTRTQLPPRFRAIVHILIALVVGFIVGYHCATPMSVTSLAVVPLSFLLGGIASAYIELANVSPIPASDAAPDHTEPNDAAP
jgi:capsular polysaccharide biosynthesis protein